MKCIFTFVVAAIVVSCGTANASIAIVNPGFESPSTATFNGLAPTGWVLSGVGSGGVWNINDAPLGSWTTTAPDGNQVAYLSGVFPGTGPGTLSQVLTSTLQANEIYTLSGQVGHPINFGSTLGTQYTAELVAGGNVIASTSGTGPEGSFTPFSLMFDSTGSAFVGQSLEIRLSSDQPQTAFDAIVLDGPADIGAVPEPGSLIVWCGSALICCAAVWARRIAVA
jgi:hypothetical protein